MCFLCNVVRLTPRLLLPAKRWEGGGRGGFGPCWLRPAAAPRCRAAVTDPRPPPAIPASSIPLSSSYGTASPSSSPLSELALIPPVLFGAAQTRRGRQRCVRRSAELCLQAQLPLWGGGAERCRYGHKAQRGRWWRGGVLRSSWAVGQQQLLENSSGGSEPSAPGGAGTFVQTLTFLCLVNN